MRRTLAVLLLLLIPLILLLGSGGQAANTATKTYVLFNGTSGQDVGDTLTKASYRIPIKGASRILLKTWTQGATGDTATTDTVATWTTLFGDSVSFIAKDSLGTLVTARSSTWWPGGARYSEFPIVLDSITIASTANVDTVRGIAIKKAPLAGTQALRWSTTQGWYTWIWPVQPILGGWGTTSQPQSNSDVVFSTEYMWVRYTPLMRLTTAGFSSTTGIRTRGLNRITCIATVYYGS